MNHDELINDIVLPDNNIIITDTFTVPSKDGSEGLGYSYKYKGKKCCKVSLTADTNGIVRLATLEPGNVHDAKIFNQTVENISLTGSVKCLADSGYVGKPLYNQCRNHNINLIAQPRKKRNGQMTHVLTPDNTFILKKYRSIIVIQWLND